MTTRFGPEQTMAVSRVSGLVLTNALIFQEILAEHDQRVPAVDEDGNSTVDLTERYALDGWKPGGGFIGNENWDVWADLDGLDSNTLKTRYVRGDAIDQVFARIESDNSIYWLLTDRLGSVRDVTDGSGTVKDTIVYDGFGNITSETDSSFRGRYAWTGRELDTETELQYNRARYYDLSIGRWTSRDPLGFDAGDSNLYRYVSNSPTTHLDSSGLQQNLRDFFNGLANHHQHDDPFVRYWELAKKTHTTGLVEDGDAPLIGWRTGRLATLGRGRIAEQARRDLERFREESGKQAELREKYPGLFAQKRKEGTEFDSLKSLLTNFLNNTILDSKHGTGPRFRPISAKVVNDGYGWDIEKTAFYKDIHVNTNKGLPEVWRLKPGIKAIPFDWKTLAPDGKFVHEGRVTPQDQYKIQIKNGPMIKLLKGMPGGGYNCHSLSCGIHDNRNGPFWMMPEEFGKVLPTAFERKHISDVRRDDLIVWRNHKGVPIHSAVVIAIRQ